MGNYGNYGFKSKVRSFFHIIWVYSWPLLVAATYVGIYFLINHTNVIDFFNDYLNHVANDWPLQHHMLHWYRGVTEWYGELNSFLWTLIMFIPMLVIVVALILVEVILCILSGILGFIYFIIVLILFIVFQIVLGFVLPIGLAGLSIFLMIHHRVDDDDYEPVLSTIICVIGCVVTVALCITFYIIMF